MVGELRPWFSTWPSLERFRRDMDELFTRFFGEGSRSPTSSMRPWRAVEFYFKDGNWIMRFDLPGIEPKDIDISVSVDTLTVRASRERWSGEQSMSLKGGATITRASSIR